MFEMKDKNIEFIISIIKCFFILLMFGNYLPKIIDYLLYQYISFHDLHENSTFVYNVINRNRIIIYKYIYTFKSFINF